MGRRSQLFSEKRGPKAIISKKRKANEELPQVCSTKLSRQMHLPDEEEEIGDFIVVDTGTLYQPEEQSQYSMTDEEVNTSSISRITPLPSINLLEEEKPLIKSSTEISSTKSEGAQLAREDFSVLPAEPTETPDSRTSRPQSLEPPEDHITFSTQNGPITLSPLPIIEEETPQFRTGTLALDNMNSSVNLLGPMVENCGMLPRVSIETQTDSPSLLLPTMAQERSASDASMQPCVSSTSETIIPRIIQHKESITADLAASKSFGDAPLGVLVTTRNRCPSKFVVSGITSNSEGGQKVPTQTVSPARHGLPWIKTVTEGGYNNYPVALASERLPSADMESIMDSSRRISTVMPLPPEKPYHSLSGIIAAINPQKSCHQPPLSDESQLPVQQIRDCENASKEVARAPPDLLQGQILADQTRQASPTETNDVLHLGSDSKKLPSPVQYPTRFPEDTTFSRLNLLDPVSHKLPNDWTTKVSFSLDNVRSDHSIESTSTVDSAFPVSTRRTSSQTLKFTSDNRAESTLTTVEVQGKIQIFVNDAIAILPREQPALPRLYPAGVILWQSLQKFHKWYAREEKLDARSKARSTQMITLKFELLDVHWQPQNVFYLPGKAALDEFRDLKQCIWDLFWVSASFIRAKSSRPFRIWITPAADLMDEAKLGQLTTACNTRPLGIPAPFPYPPSSQSSLDNMVRNFQELAPNNPHHYHCHRSFHPPQHTPDSHLATLEAGGATTPNLLLDHLQQNANMEISQRSSMQSSPTRPESHGSSTASSQQIELLHPPLERPKSMMTATLQSCPSSQFSTLPPVTKNIDSQRDSPSQRIIKTAKVISSDSQPDSISFQGNQSSRAFQLPAPQPCPEIKDPFPMITLQKQPTAADNDYAANTARPMFSVQPHKTHTAPHTILLSAQQIRVPNSSQPAPVIPATPLAIAPRLPQGKGKEPAAETSAPDSQTSRTPREQKRFRDNAMRILSNRPTLILDASETTGGRKRTYPEISGVIVDKNSEMGLVLITERGYTVQQVNTGQDVYLDEYTELTMREGQVCVIHGSSTVIYYRDGERDVWSNQVEGPRRPLPNQAPGTQIMRQQVQEASEPTPPRQALPFPAKTKAPFLQSQREQITVPPAAAEIQVRLQKDAAGHFTGPHDFSFFAAITTTELLFDWFAKRTGHGGPFGPERLRITLKDAMPVAKFYDLERDYGEAAFANTDFQRMKEDIMNECEKTKMFMPELKEFAVLVADPFWMEGNGNDMTR